MNITVFGGTGRTGRLVVEETLAAGHHVTVLVRNPAKLTTRDAHLTVLDGELTDGARVERAIAGADAVISALGPTRNQPPYEVTAVTEVVLAAMKKAKVRRLIITAGAGLPDAHDAPGLRQGAIGMLLRIFARHVFEDMKGTCERVRSSDLDWTIVRAPRLMDGPRRARLRVGYVGKGVGSSLARIDFARFVVEQLTDPAHVRKAPAISN